MQQTIALDVDDVLAAFYPGICKKMNMPEVKTNIWDGVGTCRWIANAFPDLYEDVKFWDKLSVLSNPQALTFDFDYYITSIPDSLHDSRTRWLRKHKFPTKQLICMEGSKLKVMKDLEIDVLVDDRPSTIREIRDGGKIGIQFIPYYMSNYDPDDMLSIRHLSQVPKILKLNSLREDIIEELGGMERKRAECKADNILRLVKKI